MIFLYVCLVILILLTPLFWSLWYRPLKTSSWFERQRLKSLGVREYQFEAPVGWITYYAGGQGKETMIFIHGFMAHGGTWNGVARPFLKRYNCYFPDLMGHGKSKQKDEVLMIEHIYEGFVAFMDKVIEAKQVILLGHSMGGGLVQRYVLEHPERVSKIILVNAAGLTTPLDREVFIPRDLGAAKEQMKQSLGGIYGKLPKVAYKPLLTIHNNQPQFEQLFSDFEKDTHTLDDQLHKLDKEAHLIWGGQDGFFPMDYAKRLQGAIKNSKLIEMPNEAHVPYITNPREFRKIVLEILGDE